MGASKLKVPVLKKADGLQPEHRRQARGHEPRPA
jgi:hypothetical protein